MATTGIVKWFNTQKGYGFIERDDKEADVFVHISAVEKAGIDEIREGDRLSFELEDSKMAGKKQAGSLARVS